MSVYQALFSTYQQRNGLVPADPHPVFVHHLHSVNSQFQCLQTKNAEREITPQRFPWKGMLLTFVSPIPSPLGVSSLLSSWSPSQPTAQSELWAKDKPGSWVWQEQHLALVVPSVISNNEGLSAQLREALEPRVLLGNFVVGKKQEGVAVFFV